MQDRASDVEVWAVSWWSLALRGVAAIAVGAMAIFAPHISLTALVLTFGVYALVDGILTIVVGLKRHSGRRWWSPLLEGLVGVAAGVCALALPTVTALALVYLIAGWAFVTGVLEMVAAVRLRKLIDGEWLLGLSGFLSLVLGVCLAAFPGPGAVALMFWLGAYALLFGVVLVALGLRARSWQRVNGRRLVPSQRAA
jgi:uncharacterized membrane protein HdeD (DUF308 family)